MGFVFITILTAIVTFTWVLLTKKQWRKKSNHTNFRNYHIHHSVVGLLLIVIGFFFAPFYGTVISAVGFGLFVSHGVEELYFNHEKITKAFFIFITKGKENDNI
ncbi:MAG TPA: hypothetical protein VGT05_02580 [Patescibacteria group bacterium]|nr:hypothetical protein [Patescibacteria group bacterium]